MLGFGLWHLKKIVASLALVRIELNVQIKVQAFSTIKLGIDETPSICR